MSQIFVLLKIQEEPIKTLDYLYFTIVRLAFKRKLLTYSISKHRKTYMRLVSKFTRKKNKAFFFVVLRFLSLTNFGFDAMFWNHHFDSSKIRLLLFGIIWERNLKRINVNNKKINSMAVSIILFSVICNILTECCAKRRYQD